MLAVLQIGLPADPGANPADRFERISGAPDAFEPHFAAVRRGIRLDSMRLMAPVAIRIPLDGVPGDVLLDFLATPVFNVGDGMSLEVIAAGAGGEALLLCRYFDAGRKAGDRDWVRVGVRVPVSPQRQWLVLRLSGGPQGNLEADWLAIASVHLSRRVP